MTSSLRRSFANRLAAAYLGAVIVLLLLIGCASTYFTFSLYARTSNDIVNLATAVIQRRLIGYRTQHASLTKYAIEITEDLDRPRIRVAVYDQNHRLVSGIDARRYGGVVGAIAALMNVRSENIAVPGGLIVIDVSQEQLADTLRSYCMLMLPVGLLAVLAGFGAGWLITRAAVLPITELSAAMRRFADGDCSLEPLRLRADGEFGELAHAYNGARHQILAAFAERDRSEAEMRQFIADAGHELRTPLTVIMGYIDVLEDGALEATGVRERVLKTLRQESRRMRNLIEKLIYLARLERGESSRREILNVASVIARVVRAFSEQHPEQRISNETIAGVNVLADDDDVVEIVRNLLDNARKYAPESEIEIRMELADRSVLLVVRDDGPGMSQQDRSHAFDRFYRGYGVGEIEGSGLGLAIVKRAVQRLKGSVVIESAEGEGTRVVVRLPLITRDDTQT